MLQYTAAVPWDHEMANPAADLLAVVNFLAQKGKTVTQIEFRGRAGRAQIMLGQLPEGVTFKRNDEAEYDIVMYAQVWEKVASLTVLEV